MYLPLSYAGRSGRPMVATILPSRVVLTTLGSFAFGWYSYPPFVSILCCLEPVSAIHRYSVPPSLTRQIPWHSVRPVGDDRSKSPFGLNSSNSEVPGWEAMTFPAAVTATPWCAHPSRADSVSGIFAQSSIHS